MHRALLATRMAFLITPLAAEAADEIVLRGKPGLVEVLETTETSVKVTATREDGAKITATLRATDLDPHNFYTVRRKHMEKTAKNHVALAKWCLDNDLINQATLASLRQKTVASDELDQLEAELRAELIDTCIAAGRVSLGRGAYNQAEEYGRKALQGDARSRDARHSLDQINIARALDRSDDNRRRPHRPRPR